MTMLRFGRSEW